MSLLDLLPGSQRRTILVGITKAQHAFEDLKAALVSFPVLRLPDYSKEFELETDASCEGIGAVLMQEHHPIAYLSNTLNTRQQSYSVYEKELLTLVFAVER